MHALSFLARVVGRYGDGLEEFFRSYAHLPRTLALTLRALARVGATQHREIVIEGASIMAAHNPKLGPVLEELGLPSSGASSHWTCPSQWADAPDLEDVIVAFLSKHRDQLLGDPDQLTPLEERSATHPRRSVIKKAIEERLGLTLEDSTSLDSLGQGRFALLSALGLSGLDIRGNDVNALLNAIFDKGNPWQMLAG
jgi:hypothetical protein